MVKWGRRSSAWPSCWSPSPGSSTSTRRPTSRTPTRTSRPRPRSSTTPTARPGGQLREAEPRVDPAQGRCRRNLQDAVVAAENGPSGATRASTLGDHPRCVQQRLGQLDPGRVDDHPAVREDPLPEPGALLPAQDQGSDPVAEDAGRRASPRSRGLPQHHLLRPGRVRRPGGRKAYFDKGRRGPVAQGVRGPRQRAQQPHALDPANGKQSRQDLHGATTTCSPGWRRRATSPPRRPTGRRSTCRSSRRSRPSSTAVSAATCSTMVRNELPSSLQRSGDRRRWPRVTTTFTKKAMDAAAAGSKEIRPDGQGEQGPPRRRRQRRARYRCPSGFYGGQDYLESRRSTGGGHRGAGRLDVRCRSPWGPRWRAGPSSRTPSTATRRTTTTARAVTRCATRTRARRVGDYGTVSLLTATEESINTAFADLTMSMDDGPTKIIKTANRTSASPAEGQVPHGYNNIDNSPASSPSRASRSARRRSLRSTWPTPTRRSRTAGEQADVHVIDKVGRGRRRSLQPAHVPAFDPGRQQRGHRRRRRTPCSRSSRTRHRRRKALLRPAGGKTGTPRTPTTTCRRRGSWATPPQLATAVMYVRGKGNEQLDGWLPTTAVSWLLRRQLPRPHLDRGHAEGHGGLPVEDFPEPAYLDGRRPRQGTSRTPAAVAEPRRRRSRPRRRRTPSETPTQTPSETPGQTPTQTPSPTCTLLGGCGTVADADPVRHPSTPPPSQSGGRARAGAKRQGRRRRLQAA